MAVGKRLKRQLSFLQSVLQEANRKKRQEQLHHANSDQINAISEVVLNLFKNNIPVTPTFIAKLRPHKQALITLGQRRQSIKKRRNLLMNQRGSGLFKGLNDVVCQCLR